MAIRFATASRSPASGSTITAALPPSSRETLRSHRRCFSPQPTWAEPVKLSSLTRGSSRRASASAPPHGTTLTPPAGTPARCRISASSSAGEGVWEAGLSTIGHPAATAGASLCATRLSGKLNGVIPTTTPTGKRRSKPEAAGAGREALQVQELGVRASGRRARPRRTSHSSARPRSGTGPAACRPPRPADAPAPRAAGQSRLRPAPGSRLSGEVAGRPWAPVLLLRRRARARRCSAPARPMRATSRPSNGERTVIVPAPSCHRPAMNTPCSRMVPPGGTMLTHRKRRQAEGNGRRNDGLSAVFRKLA